MASAIPYSPATGGSPIRHHSRGPTLGRSLSSTTSFADCPLSGMPRTLCPRDADAFSFDPAHLDAWAMPNDLWMRLPRPIVSCIAAMQHAGAAVLTGFERLEELRSGLTPRVDASSQHEREDGLPTAAPSGPSLETLLASMTTDETPKYEYRARVDSLVAADSATAPSPSVRSSISTSGVSTPGLDTTATPATPASPASPATPPSGPTALLCKTDFSPFAPLPGAAASRDEFVFSCANQSPPPAAVTHEFSKPLDPHEAYYTAELRELKRSAVVRLRHAARRVETEWAEYVRKEAVEGGDKEEFDHWWAGKRRSSAELQQKVKKYEDVV